MYSIPLPPPAVSNRIFRPDENGRIVLAIETGLELPEPGPTLTAINGALRAFITHDAYPCVGAKSALNKGSYRLAQYQTLGEQQSVEQCTADVQWFARAADSIDPHAASFIAVFDDPSITDEAVFEDRLWSQLRGMHAIDSSRYNWDSSVSDDPDDPDFSFSIGGHAFFIIGMHPYATREARRFPYPTLVFNLHTQFVQLRESGSFEQMKSVIRSREEQLQGDPNPLVADHGTSSEAIQYAGRAHKCPWHAPFPADNGEHGEQRSEQ